MHGATLSRAASPAAVAHQGRQRRAAGAPPAQVVPAKERSQVYAFDKTIAGAVGALSNVIVPLIAQYVFHYRINHDARPSGHQSAVRAWVG